MSRKEKNKQNILAITKNPSNLYQDPLFGAYTGFYRSVLQVKIFLPDFFVEVPDEKASFLPERWYKFLCCGAKSPIKSSHSGILDQLKSKLS